MIKQIAEIISIAGLYHDIGKVAERAKDVDSVNKDEVHQEYRYSHAYHTEKVLTTLFKERVSWCPEGFPSVNVLNLASRHHNPRNNYEHLIAEADRLASGHERMKSDKAADYDVEGRERKSKVPLISIFSRIRLEDIVVAPLEEDWRYRLTPVTSVFSSYDLNKIYPCRSSDYTAPSVEKDYRKLWHEFKEAIKIEKHGKKLDLFDNAETLYEIYREYMWCLPASTRKEEMPDVSLFEHSKATATLASCLYLFHAGENGRIDESYEGKKRIRDRSKPKFLLFCGDISGIQKFVYQISSKGAYRALKGRSFMIQLLSELLARKFVNEFGLYSSNILYASGGKFYLLLPNTEPVRSRLEDLKYILNKWLFSEFSGDLYIRMAFKELSGNDLTRQSGETLCDIWDRLTRELLFADRRKYDRLATQDYELLFGVEKYLPNTCIVCHRSIASNEGDNRCKTCRRMEEMGKLLKTASHIIIGEDSHEINEQPCIFKLVSVFRKDIYAWILPGEEIPENTKGNLSVFCINQGAYQEIPLNFVHPERVNSGLLILGANHGFDATFEEIAERAKGIKRLGILRMDVDNLGKIFSQGLKRYKHDEISDERFYSLGRITTLSFQLHLFFGGIVPQLIVQQQPQRTTVVYSGGDDLFLLGTWDAMPSIGLEIKRAFRKYTCLNDCFGLSGGIVITGGKFPIYKSAELAGEAVAKAKNYEYETYDGNRQKKNSLTFLDRTASWPEFEELSDLYEEMVGLFKDSKFYPLLGRLRQISYLWERDKWLFTEKGRLTMEEIRDRLMAEKWRWRMVYSLSRFSENYDESKESIRRIQSFAINKMKTTKTYGIEFLPLLSRWWELSLRGEKARGGV